MQTIKAIIILPQTSIYSPAKIDEFIWSDQYKAHVWLGRALAMDEFNTISHDLFFARRERIEEYDLPPYVQLVAVAAEEPSKPAAVIKPPRRKNHLDERMKRIVVPKIPVENLVTP